MAGNPEAPGASANAANVAAFPVLCLSHFELFVRDIARMEAFYTRRLGFNVTDREPGRAGMVFLSRNPAEHHQLVLNQVDAARRFSSPLDHISFRAGTMADLRAFHRRLRDDPGGLDTVSHGNTWSIYFRDPENNRLEIFTDTPWHVNQPCRFEIDLELPEPELIEFTRRTISGLPGFRERRPGSEA